jgi:flagellar biogenesis protein FliO
MISKKSIFQVVIFTLVIVFLQSYSAFAINNDQIKNLKINDVSYSKKINNGSKSQQLSQGSDSSVPDLENNKNKSSGEPSFLNLMSSLSIVIILIFATGWIYAKLSRINANNLFAGKLNQISNNTFKIISTVQLGPNKTLHLIEINNKQLIIGCTQDKINLITEMNKNEESSSSAPHNDLLQTLLADKNSSTIDKTIESIDKNDEVTNSFVEDESVYKKYLD